MAVLGRKRRKEGTEGARKRASKEHTVQLPSSSDTDHRDDTAHDKQPGRSAIGRATRLVRFVLYALSYIGGAATGTSAMTLVLYQPTDWRWAWLGAGGLLAGACAVGLIPYFPKDDGEEP